MTSLPSCAGYFIKKADTKVSATYTSVHQYNLLTYAGISDPAGEKRILLLHYQNTIHEKCPVVKTFLHLSQAGVRAGLRCAYSWAATKQISSRRWIVSGLRHRTLPNHGFLCALKIFSQQKLFLLPQNSYYFFLRHCCKFIQMS